MSQDCVNPNCPVHGTGPEAKARRENRQHIVVNQELMSVIRLLAANTHQKMAETVDLSDAVGGLQEAILRGEADADPIVQGLINGFSVLLTKHYPTQQFAGLCFQVEEKDNVITKLLGRPFPPTSARSGNVDLLQFLALLARMRR